MRKNIGTAAALAALLALSGCAAPAQQQAIINKGVIYSWDELNDNVHREDYGLLGTGVAVDQTGHYLPRPIESLTGAAVADYITYTVNDENAGYLCGEIMHNISDGPSQGVRAVAKLGYRFLCWSDGVTTPLRSGDTASESTVLVACFEYDVMDMPLLVLNTETGADVSSKTEYIGGSLSILGCEQQYTIYDKELQVRGRGNNSWTYEKKSYKIKLGSKQNLLGIADEAGKVWVLLANMCDGSLLRNQVSLSLQKALGRISWSPAATSVELYLNGEYRGVYLLCEEIKTGSGRVDICENTESINTGYLLELTGYQDDNMFWVGGHTYRVVSDLSQNETLKQQQMQYINAFLQSCYDVLQSGNLQAIEAYIDVASLVDCYLLEEITKNLDQDWDSFYLYKDKDGKLTFGPAWDFDLAIGNADNGTEITEGLYAATTAGSNGGNPWFYTLMHKEWFRTMVSARWSEIKQTVSEIPVLINSLATQSYNSYCRNFEKWDYVFGTRMNRETPIMLTLLDYTMHYTYLATWAQARIDWLDDYYASVWFEQGQFIGVDNYVRNNYYFANQQAIAQQLANANLIVNPQSITVQRQGELLDGICLFDSSDQTMLCTDCAQGLTVSFCTSTPVAACAVMLKTAQGAAGNPLSWRIAGSVDGEYYVPLLSVSGNSMAQADYTYTVYQFANKQPYSYFTIEFDAQERLNLSEIRLLYTAG